MSSIEVYVFLQQKNRFAMDAQTLQEILLDQQEELSETDLASLCDRFEEPQFRQQTCTSSHRGQAKR